MERKLLFNLHLRLYTRDCVWVEAGTLELPAWKSVLVHKLELNTWTFSSDSPGNPLLRWLLLLLLFSPIPTKKCWNEEKGWKPHYSSVFADGFVSYTTCLHPHGERSRKTPLICSNIQHNTGETEGTTRIISIFRMQLSDLFKKYL